MTADVRAVNLMRRSASMVTRTLPSPGEDGPSQNAGSTRSWVTSRLRDGHHGGQVLGPVKHHCELGLEGLQLFGTMVTVERLFHSS